MATFSPKYGLPIPTKGESPDMPQAIADFTESLEKHLEKNEKILNLAAIQAADYDKNGIRKKGFIPNGADVHDLDYGLWTLSSAWAASKDLTNMPSDPRADAPGNLEVLPFASGLRMMRWTTAALSSSATPYSWVKFQGYAAWGPWKEISPEVSLTSVAGLTGAVSAVNLADALRPALAPWITEAVSQAAIEAAKGDIQALDARYRVEYDGTNNTIMGKDAIRLRKYPEVRNNTAMGLRALYNLTKGRYNDFFGGEAGYSLDGAGFPEAEGKASRNAGFGTNTQRFNKTGSLNVSMGRNSLQSNVSGTHNTAIGADSSGGIAHMRLSDGQIENQIPQNFWGNTAVGAATLTRTQDNQQVAIGAHALREHKVGVGNTAVGFGAMRLAGRNGGYNGKTFFDLSKNSSYKGLNYRIADQKCIISVPSGHPFRNGFMLECDISGFETQFWYVESFTDTSVILTVGMPGYSREGTLNILNYSDTTVASPAERSIALGFQAGQYMDDGSEAHSISNAVAIGADARFAGDNTIMLGNSQQTVHVYAPVQVRSDVRDKSEVKPLAVGLSFIKKLRPVQYRLAPRSGAPADRRIHAGLIAQEVAEAAKGTDFQGVIENGGAFSIAYEELIPVLVEAVQELCADVAMLKEAR